MTGTEPAIAVGMLMLTVGIVLAFVAVILFDRRPQTRRLGLLVWSGALLAGTGAFVAALGFLLAAAAALP